MSKFKVGDEVVLTQFGKDNMCSYAFSGIGKITEVDDDDYCRVRSDEGHWWYSNYLLELVVIQEPIAIKIELKGT